MKTNEKLLARFNPAEPKTDYGLFEDVGVLNQQARAFYRLGQW